MAATATLIDTFSGAALNTSKWTDTSFTGGTVALGGGELVCTPVPASANTSGNITSATTYDLTGSYILVKVAGIVAQNGATIMYAVKDSTNKLFFQILTGTLYAKRTVAAVDAEVTTTYNANIHRWLRIRESAGTIFYDYSPDSITWTNLTSVANPFVITAVSVVLEGYDFSADAAPGSARFVNFNFPPGPEFHNGLKHVEVSNGMSRSESAT